MQQRLHGALEALYRRNNRRNLISPDPLEVVYAYGSRADREAAGLIAACLAYGRVAQILVNVRVVLAGLGPHPAAALRDATRADLTESYGTFRHRWTDGAELVDFLTAMGRVLRDYGSLERCFVAHCGGESETVLKGLTGFVRELGSGGSANSLLPRPEKGSACKRLHLYLRWMVRSDAVDPGCWRGVSPSWLIVPLDTHMHRIARSLGLTRRKQANLATALEVTEAFRRMNPTDPLKYDFALTRLGIRADMDVASFLEAYRSAGAA